MTKEELKKIKEQTKIADDLISIINKINNILPEIQKSEECNIEISNEKYNKSYDKDELGWGNSEYYTVKTSINADELGMNSTYFNNGFKDVLSTVLIKFRKDAQTKLDELSI